MVLNTNLNYALGGKNQDQDDDMFGEGNEEGEDGHFREDMDDYGMEYGAEENGHHRGDNYLEGLDNEKHKKLGESNVEKVVSENGFLYFITKDAKDAPLDSHCKPLSLLMRSTVKMEVPDKTCSITDD